MSNTTDRHDPYAALRHPYFRMLLAGRFLTSFGNEMLSFGISWGLWLRTHNAFALGMVGLVQVVPVILLSLVAGHVADPYSRKLALAQKSATWSSLTEGFRFMRDTKVILAAITLDMFAVLFGGAVALLPIYATDILKVGAQGLGIMRAAPSIGALTMAFALAHLPPMKNAGRTLLLTVTGFGVATIIFGMSTSFLLSVFMLAALGAFDNISVVIRGTLLLTQTPDKIPGRISSVNSIFIGISNELGSFESGLAAALFGPILAVVGGGIGTILVVLAVMRIWPQVGKLKTLDVPTQELA